MEGWWRGRWGDGGSLHSSSQPHLLQPCHLEEEPVQERDSIVGGDMHQWMHYWQRLLPLIPAAKSLAPMWEPDFKELLGFHLF